MKERQVHQLCLIYNMAYDEFARRKKEFPQGYYAENTEIEGSVDAKGHLFITASLRLRSLGKLSESSPLYFFLVPLLVRYKGSEKNIQDFVPISVMEIKKNEKIILDSEVLENKVIVKGEPDTKLILRALKIKIDDSKTSCPSFGELFKKETRIEVKLILKNYAMLSSRFWPVEKRKVMWYFKVRPSKKGDTKYASFQIMHPSRAAINFQKEETEVEKKGESWVKKNVAEIHSNKLIFIAAFKDTTQAAAYYEYQYVPEYLVVGFGFFFAAIVTLIITFLGSWKCSCLILVAGIPVIIILFWSFIGLIKKFLR